VEDKDYACLPQAGICYGYTDAVSVYPRLPLPAWKAYDIYQSNYFVPPEILSKLWHGGQA